MIQLSNKMGNIQFFVHDFPFDGPAFRALEEFSSARPDHNIVVLPGFADVHVHFREPGFSYKETIRTGTLAAARGGYTAICAMPNVKPVPDNLPALQIQLARIAADAAIPVLPYGAITVEERGQTLADLKGMAPYVAGFSDDGHGVQSAARMREAMAQAKALGKIITAHCEDNALLRGGYIHDGAYARTHGHRGICSESEWGPIKRDLALVAETGCAYHVCHISAKESVSLVREAKKRGLNVSCETAPHYLVLNDSMLEEDGRFKMNPPIRSKADQAALIEGLLDGTIDCIATDHAPHTVEEKSKGLEHSLMGVVGLETAFPVLYTHLVRTGILTLTQLAQLLSENPRARFGIQSDPGFTVFDLDAQETIDPDSFLSMGRATPFSGARVSAQCLMTVQNGSVIWGLE